MNALFFLEIAIYYPLALVLVGGLQQPFQTAPADRSLRPISTPPVILLSYVLLYHKSERVEIVSFQPDLQKNMPLYTANLMRETLESAFH